MNIAADIENTSREDMVVLDGAIRIGPGAKILAGTQYEPPIYIADDARVLSGVSLGRYTYVGRRSIVVRADIGRYCSIAHDCEINYFRSHPTDWLSTHPFQFDSEIFSFWPDYEKFSKQSFDADASQEIVTISHDVWLGAGTGIFGGVTIGIGAITGARALVTKNLPAFSISFGSPAKVRRYRFRRDIQKKILESKWWDMDEELRTAPFQNPKDFCSALITQKKTR